MKPYVSYRRTVPKTIRCRDKTLGALALLFCELKATSLLHCYWPLFSAPTYLFDDLIEQLRVYILPVSSYSKSNPSSNFVYQPLLSISQASPIGFCCCCYCDFCAESVEYFVSLLLWLLDDNIDMNRSIVFQSLQWSKEKWGISQTTLTRSSKLQVTF